MRDDFFEHLLRCEPEVMLRSDISKVQNERKAQLVEAVLERAGRAELFDDRNFHRFSTTLNHADLAGQLRPYITDTGLNVVVRRMAMKIAGGCCPQSSSGRPPVKLGLVSRTHRHRAGVEDKVRVVAD